MYLSNLKIHGFKSFAKKTTLEFNGGLTCIVGPNGCGKSNIVDAVRWVLGEQRSGILRSEKMENVIFSGSKVAKPLGMAEVSMTIQNTRNVLPIEYSEVTITRRFFRSGESEYLLNKSLCRLKDIRDLFLDTGVGPDSYSVIELKMVETILSSKSEERLELFEEAAGINKYKHRRNAAFRKLDATEIDLNRVTDILAEVDRNVNSLKRQVSRAERYQAFAHEIEELEIRAASLEYAGLRKKLVPMKHELAQIERNYQENRTSLVRDEADLERKRSSLLKMEDGLSRLQGEISSLTESIYRKENEVVATQERIKALEEKIQRYSQERGQLQKRLEILRQRIADGEPQVKTLGEKVDSLRMRYRLKKQELDEFEKLLARRRLEANETRVRLIELMETISTQEKQRNSLESQLLHLEGRKEQLGAEIEHLQQAQQQITQEQEKWTTQNKTLEKKFNQTEIRLNSLRKKLLESQQQQTQIHEQHLQLLNKSATLEQQRAFLANLIEINEGYPDGVQFILAKSKNQPGTLGLLADLISVPKEFRLAVEAILGEKSFYVVVKTEANAFQLMRQLREKKMGQVTFLVLERLQKMSPARVGAPPVMDGVLARASDVIQTAKALQPVVQLLFGSYLLVRDTEVWQSLGAHDRWLAATLQGEVMAPNGVLRSGRYSVGETVSKVSRTGQLQELQEQLTKIKIQITQTETALSTQQQETKKLEEDVALWNRKVKEIEEEFQQSRIAVAQRQTALANLATNLKSSRSELEKIDSTWVESNAQIQKLKPELQELIRKRRRYEDETELFQEKLTELETQRNGLAEAVHELNVEQIKTIGEQNTLDADLKRMQRTLTEVENTIVQHETELQEANQEIVSSRQKVAEAQAELSRLRQRKNTLLSSLTEQKQEYQVVQQDVSQKETQLKKARQVGESSADVLQNLRLAISENEMQIQNLQKGIFEKYRVEITPIEPGMQDELANFQSKLDALREKLRLHGPVNLLALEEYKKESERLEFLHRQKNDLVEARDTLLETIQIINKTAHEKFEEVFNQIRENFRRNFESFFEGGEGDLRIRFDAEDPLLANVIILARPRGKQLGALELLSAGEKALTAIALLFSIYQVKPSPFCILDEVDAPLDDVNVRRFLRVLQNFADNTQFLIVTHNKLTMAAADYIYGVTMAEEGISKIVSVEMSHADDFIDSNQEKKE